jgi:exosortase
MQGSRSIRSWGAFVSLAAAFGLLYREVFIGLVQNWLRDPNYSHGFLVLPLVAYLVWQRRERLRNTPQTPSTAGLAVIAASLLALLVGTAGVEFFLMRVSAVGVAAGCVLYLGGWRWLRVLAFPLAFAMLMIPIPAIVFYPVAFKLQLLATRLGVAALELVRVPVLREGNVILLPRATLEVAQACSGIRSLMALFTLSLIYGYFVTTSRTERCLVAIVSIPIAIVANAVRVAATGLAVEFIGPYMASESVHTWWGGAVFLLSLLLLAGFVRGLEAGRRFHLVEARAR